MFMMRNYTTNRIIGSMKSGMLLFQSRLYTDGKVLNKD